MKEEVRSFQIDEAKATGYAPKKKGLTADKFSFRHGGLFRTSFRNYKNIDNQKSLEDFLKKSWLQEAQFWMQMNYGSDYGAYFQLNNAYIDRAVGPTYSGIGADFKGPSVSTAYLKADLEKHGLPLIATLGRQYFFLGRGVAYGALHDGLLLEKSGTGPIRIKGLIAKSKSREDNVDYSVPGFDKEGDRVFVGAEIGYSGLPNAFVYLYGLVQKDNASSNPENPRQNYRYDSQYLGSGLSVNFGENLESWSEIIGERGNSFTDAARTDLRETDINAWAFLSGLKYRPKLPTKPVLEGSFAHGSGDDDRTNVTNTEGGDRDGTDTNFLYFGYYLGGYALQPRLSNLNILQLGASFQPLEGLSAFKKLAVGTKYYVYWKDEAEGAMSNARSSDADGDVGSEFDLFLHWSISKHYFFSMRYGIFYPGEAFSEEKRNNTEYFFSSVTFTY